MKSLKQYLFESKDSHGIEFVDITYKDKQYKCRSIEWKWKDEDDEEEVLIGTESLQKLLIDEDGSPRNSEAESIDDRILYYVPDDMINATDRKLIKYLRDNME